MKAFIAIMITAVSVSAFAKSAVWCKDEGQAIDAEGDYGQACAEALAFGEACFTGKRSEVIATINAGKFDADEEWLENAKYKGRDAISYVWVDGPNELREKQTLPRCAPDFFTK
ncbi:MAG: hypothetical protein AAB250_02280 [Bdellovibrionota bacterium]